MPEGHTLHRLARDHREQFAGQRVSVSSPQGRFSAAAALLDGSVLEDTEAYGKHLFHHYEADRSVHVHLGLYGSFVPQPVPPPAPRDTVRYRVVGQDHATDLIGATACELLGPDEVEAIRSRLGPDPLREDGDPELAFEALRRRRTGIGQALMDQRVLAGVGNVYRAEVLSVHRLHPDTPARDVDRDRWAQMWATLQTWLRRGVEEQVIITVDPEEVGMPREALTPEDGRYVYKQEHCRRCGTAVRRYDVAGRWAYVCESCQPKPRRRRSAA